MTNNNHPITPPPDLVQKLADGPATWLEKISKAYCAGADQELEACCEWLTAKGWILPIISHELRDTRRPNPPGLQDQALDDLERIAALLMKNNLPCDTGNIRRALESLPD